ncbi:hypothetical protein COCMIDRAFT_21998 [Bipolaris oryzae ATCC 44560]|uniref:Uncharacterized protein n=1 Tax=Bipolaris oryzae ATCC 44560 TaxID=930090 RepID=W6ZS91_COCMI|nr:uncharacterized protein COCMIDRAFT_21998 [Bipolaris oryzae ATCC 44560]EUC50379.1 hypothetical protein COCMIDRAFT_21998 [Bipolaris oryzae ATCC 44560]
MPHYNTPVYYPISSPSHGLPSDEYKHLKRQQEKSHLQRHLSKKHILPPPPSSSSFPSPSPSPSYPPSSYSSNSSFPPTPSSSSSFPSSSYSSSYHPTSPYPQTPYQQRNLPHAQRVHISAVKNATRKALASVFDAYDAYDGVCEAWPRSRYDGNNSNSNVYGCVRSRGDVDEYYERSKGRGEKRGSGESMRVGYHNMGYGGYGYGYGKGEDFGGPRLGSKFSFDSLDGV